MKIDTEIKEGTAGLFSKKVHILSLTAHFTEEETAQIEKVGLTKKHDTNNIVKNFNGKGGGIFLDHLMRGTEFTFQDADLTIVTSVQNRIIAALKNVKEYTTAVSDTGRKTIEL